VGQSDRTESDKADSLGPLDGDRSSK
jgi:hypothetical protein